MTIMKFASSVPKRCLYVSASYLQYIKDPILNEVRQFVSDEIIPNASKFDATGEFPWDLVRKAHRLGIINTRLDLDLKTRTFIYRELSYGCPTIASALMISELAQFPLLIAGSDYLKEKYIKRMINEPILAAYATTEKEAGSDLAKAEMSAIQDGNSYILNGTKVWVSNCGLASWFFVLAKTSPSESTGKAFTGFIVDRDFEGVIIGEKEPTMGQKCGYIGSLTLNDVRVPKENIVGPVGKGFSIAMRAFDRVRPLVASLACGIQQRALNESTQYAIQRKTFGTSIINHQSVGSKLAVMAQNLEASKLLILQAADKIDNGDSDSTYLSSIAKCFSSDAALQASINAIQIFGANGYSSKFAVEKLLRDSNALQFMSGTNDIQKTIITRHLAKQSLQSKL